MRSRARSGSRTRTRSRKDRAAGPAASRATPFRVWPSPARPSRSSSRAAFRRSSLTVTFIEQRDEKFVQLRELTADPACAPRRDGLVESFLRGIEVAHDDEGLGATLLEGYRCDGPTSAIFVIRPDEAGVRYHFDVLAEERHGLVRGGVAEHETVCAARAHIGLAGNESNSIRLRRPPPHEQIGRGPRREHDARGAVEPTPDDHLTLGCPFHRRGVRLLLFSCVHG